MARTREIITTTIKEYDDSVGGTVLPPNIPDSDLPEKQIGTMTHPTDNVDSIEDKEETTGKSNQQKPGHTWPDIFVEYKNDYRVMLVLFIVISFAIFSPQIESSNYLKYSGILSAILNLVWFLSPVIVRLFRK